MTKIVPSMIPRGKDRFYSSSELEDWDYQVLRSMAGEVPTDQIEGSDTKGDIAFFFAHNYSKGEIDDLRKRVK